MNRENKKMTELNVAIGLALILLAVIVVIFVRGSGVKPPLVREPGSEKEKVITGPQVIRPGLEEFEESTFPGKTASPLKEGTVEAEQEEDLLPAVTLKDLPLDRISQDEQMPEEEVLEEAVGDRVQTRPLELRPTPEEIKTLKQKNLIIY